MTDSQIGIVVIGRNEGTRLKVCLESVVQFGSVVYVDSGSTDDSVAIARQLGVEVVNLDVSIPFTAARARNEGFNRLYELNANLEYVQFVDGDCEVITGWFNTAKAFLDKNTEVAVVCGQRKERFPDASVYNMLCDIEWNTPIGEAKACGGDALMRINAFNEVSGYNPKVIAGEEPELCVRLRQKGWKIWRIDAQMTLHDANISRFSQWWRRNVRSGYAFALGASMHGALPERHWLKEVKRTQLWTIIIPLILAVATFIKPSFIILVAIYPIQITRLAIKNKANMSRNWLYASYVMLGKFPEMQGQLSFYINRLFNNEDKIIEYKN